jgi:transcriptional regulator with PAS, ATPase and Fis domain
VVTNLTSEWAPALAGSPAPAVVIDCEGRILHANRRFVFNAAFHGRTVGRHCYEVCHLADHQCPAEECPISAAHSRAPIRRAVHVHRTTGFDRLTCVVARPITDPPNPTYVMAFRSLLHVSAVPHRTNLVGRSPAFRRLLEQIDRVADAPIPLLIVGEPGSGKQHVARTLHRMSRRFHDPFVIIDCPVPGRVMEVGERDIPLLRFNGLLGWAGRGTLFVDHLQGLTAFHQALLLRLVDSSMNRNGWTANRPGRGARVIVASDTPLDDLPEGQTVRADLAETLSIFPIEVPPLRSRVEDIPLLAESLLLRLSVAAGRVWHLTPAGAACLQGREYPGNVRELAYVVERAALAAQGDELGPENFAFHDACLEPVDAAGGRPPAPPAGQVAPGFSRGPHGQEERPRS